MSKGKGKDKEKQTYEVGYMKPPREHRFTSKNQPKVSGGKASGYKHFKSSLWKVLQDLADDHGMEDPLELLAEKLVAMALGDKYNRKAIPFDKRLSAINTILDRLEGKPGQRVEIEETKVIANLAWINREPFTEAEVIEKTDEEE